MTWKLKEMLLEFQRTPSPEQASYKSQWLSWGQEWRREGKKSHHWSWLGGQIHGSITATKSMRGVSSFSRFLTPMLVRGHWQTHLPQRKLHEGRSSLRFSSGVGGKGGVDDLSCTAQFLSSLFGDQRGMGLFLPVESIMSVFLRNRALSANVYN